MTMGVSIKTCRTAGTRRVRCSASPAVIEDTKGSGNRRRVQNTNVRDAHA